MNKLISAIFSAMLCFTLIVTPQVIASNNKASALDELISTYERLGRFNGAVAIKKGNDVVYQRANGYANEQVETTNGVDKIFAIGSLSKQFTATAILLLVQQKKLALNDPIAKHLPYYQNEVGNLVTIHHLLTHTAGIPDPMDTGEGIDGKNDPLMHEKTLSISKEKLILTFKDLPNDFAPGERHKYSNTGYVLLADIIERTSAMSYADFLQEFLFFPAGMENTSAQRPLKSKYLVESYNGIGEDKVHTTKIHNSWLIGAGSIYSTTSDLFKWTVAMNTKKILRNAQLSHLVSAPVDLHVNNTFYGYGMEKQTIFDHLVYRHDGATAGTISDFLYFPKEDTTIIIYINKVHNVKDINLSINMRDKLVTEITGILFKPTPLFGSNQPLQDMKTKNQDNTRYDSQSLSQYVGVYTFNDKNNVTITLENNALLLKTIGDDNWSLYNLAQITPLSKEAKVERSTLLFSLLNTNELDGLSNLFDEKMASLPASVFAGFWQQLTSELGSLESNYSFAKSHDRQEISQRLIFEKGIVDMAVFFNEQGRIEGISNSSPISKVSSFGFESELLLQGNNQLMIDGYVLKKSQDLILNFTRNKQNEITGFSYHQMGQHVATKVTH